MVYKLKDRALKISAGYEIIDPDRQLRFGLFGVQEPSVKFSVQIKSIGERREKAIR